MMFQKAIYAKVWPLLAALAITLVGLASLSSSGASAAPMALATSALTAYDSGFSYQGTLSDGGTPANGVYDFRFELLADGGAVGQEVVVEDVAVTQGLFATTVGIKSSAMWNGERRLLRVAARADGETDFVVIGEPQPIEPALYAFHARQASSATQADVATTLADVGNTVVQVGTFNMMQSDGSSSLDFAAKNSGRLQVTSGNGLKATRYVYIPVDVPSEVIGFGQRLAAMRFCYSGVTDNGLGVLAGIQQANVRQVNNFSAHALLGEAYAPQLSATDQCVTITAENPQVVTGSLWVRFQITASAAPLEFGEITLTFTGEN